MVRTLGIVVAVIAFVMVVSTVMQFHRKKITPAWALFWSGIWIIGATLTFFTGWLDALAEQTIGVEGRMFVIYLSILFLFLINYRLFLKQKTLEADISRVVEEVAKRDAKKKR